MVTFRNYCNSVKASTLSPDIEKYINRAEHIDLNLMMDEVTEDECVRNMMIITVNGVHKRGTIMSQKDYEDRHILAIEWINFIVSHLPITSRIIHMYGKMCESILNESFNMMKYINVDFLPDREYYLICKKAVMHRHGLLADIDNSKLALEEYEEVCNIALKKNPGAIQYIKGFITDEMYENGVNSSDVYIDVVRQSCTREIIRMNECVHLLRLYGKYCIPSRRKLYQKLCLIFVERSGSCIEYVNVNLCTDYYQLALISVKLHGYYITYMYPECMSEREYEKVYLAAGKSMKERLTRLKDKIGKDTKINKVRYAIKAFARCIAKGKKARDMYVSICELIVRYNGKFLNDVDESKMTLDSYYKLSMKAVKGDGMCVKYVRRINPDLYTKVCRRAFLTNPKSSRYIDRILISAEQFSSICARKSLMDYAKIKMGM